MKQIITLFTIMLSAGCGFEIGPAYPERDGREFLHNHGYPATLIDSIVNGEKLDHSVIVELSKCRSTNVRYLVASNPNLTYDEIDIFIQDKNDFVRSGSACNINLSSKQIETLTADLSHTVYCQLAGNTSLSEDALLSIHVKRNPGLVWFACNPNCPDSIRQEIMNSNKSLEKQWLDTMDGWKKDGIYIQRDNGRWYKPLPHKSQK
jgi:hypothetical protein